MRVPLATIWDTLLRSLHADVMVGGPVALGFEVALCCMHMCVLVQQGVILRKHPLI